MRANPIVKLVPWYSYVRIHTKGSNKPSVPQALKKRKKKKEEEAGERRRRTIRQSNRKKERRRRMKKVNER